jgi:hypothetical protein
MGRGGADYLDDSDDVFVEGPARSLFDDRSDGTVVGDAGADAERVKGSMVPDGLARRRRVEIEGREGSTVGWEQESGRQADIRISAGDDGAEAGKPGAAPLSMAFMVRTVL